MNWSKRLGKWLFVSAAVTATGAAGSGCLTRPVGTQPPTTKVNFTSSVSQQQVDKVDLLFMIDNSASMGDKQAILAEAVPELLKGLLQPKCIDTNGQQVGGKFADPNGNQGNKYNCPEGSEPEFRPVTDMHIGIISSSLGSLGGDVCPDAEARKNDKAHLLKVVKGGAPAPAVGKSNFLAWYPSNDENDDKKRHPDPERPIATLDELQTNFQNLVVGVDQTGCGLEAQLESFYRFLIQPDPWVSVKRDGKDQADLGGATEVDIELLQQRADFLREDSLVAIIELTDEDDSSADPLSVGGQGWAFMAKAFPGSTVKRGNTADETTAPRATSVCQTNPGATGRDKDGNVVSVPCTSCGFAANCNAAEKECQLIKADPECAKNGGYYGPREDQLNVRFHRMKERYGIDPQYPISRYVDGLTKPKVPDRSTEHAQRLIDPNDPSKGRVIGPYQSVGKCTNPLFAKRLPRQAGDALCDLQRSDRGPDLIFFAVVGGVPNALLHFTPNDPDASRITSDDWVKILGRDPTNYNYEGIDPHMIQSVSPRPNLPPPAAIGNNGPDPDKGQFREWDTQQDDLQYACTFKLPTPRACKADDPSCDCGGGKAPPLCQDAGTQTYAKAYPTTREFMVVRALNDQGIIASLCPITLEGDKTSPNYGYNPAVNTIIDRLKNALTTQCLPQRLTRDDASKEVPCLVLAQLEETDSCEAKNLPKPPADILDKFLEQQRAESGDPKDGGVDLSKRPVCVLKQLVVDKGQTCKDNSEKGWCYVENAPPANPAKNCPQALIFSTATAALQGARFSLQCIQQFSATEDAAAQPQQ